MMDTDRTVNTTPGKTKGEKTTISGILPALLLVLTAMIWGFAFVSQSVGAEYIGAFTFLAVRCWIAVAFLIPVSMALFRMRTGKSAFSEVASHRDSYLRGGVICGMALFAGAASQQIGIAYTTTAKAGFITALYVVLVPVISAFAGKNPGLRVWISVIVGTIGLYFLCMTGAAGGFNLGDGVLMLCALFFSIQILSVNHFIAETDGILLSLSQTLMEGILATAAMLIFEKPVAGQIRAALPALLFAGILSSGVGFTLQIIAQEKIDPTVASLIMCLESVFSAIGGWLFLHQILTKREFFGCALMFAAIIYSQIPGEGKMRRKRAL